MPLIPTLGFLGVLALLGPGCGPRGETGIPEGQAKPWAELDDGERMEHMGAVVLPRMQALFQGHDPERFGDFSCATCHGNGGDFHMPSPSLPVLDASNFYKTHRKNQPDMVKLMWKEVVPAMGEALAVTHGHGGRVDCGTCHIVENAPD